MERYLSEEDFTTDHIEIVYGLDRSVLDSSESPDLADADRLHDHRPLLRHIIRVSRVL
jgi:hypothetical protein